MVNAWIVGSIAGPPSPRASSRAAWAYASEGRRDQSARPATLRLSARQQGRGSRRFGRQRDLLDPRLVEHPVPPLGAKNERPGAVIPMRDRAAAGRLFNRRQIDEHLAGHGALA